MYLVEHQDGSVGQYSAKPGTDHVEEGKRWVELPREIDFVAERWDWDAGAIVPFVDGALAKIDRDHAAGWSQDIIGIAHVQKSIEARIMLAGVAIDGLIAREARVIGIDPLERARAIAATAAAPDSYEAAEVARIVARRGARNVQA